MRFDCRKTTQIIARFAELNGGSIGKLQVMKLIYVADRLHLRRYGRTVTRDEYFAMQYGPVPSAAKEIAALSTYLDPREREYAARFIRPADDHKIHLAEPPDTEVFSESDEEVIRDFLEDPSPEAARFELCPLNPEKPQALRDGIEEAEQVQRLLYT